MSVSFRTRLKVPETLLEAVEASLLARGRLAELLMRTLKNRTI